MRKTSAATQTTSTMRCRRAKGNVGFAAGNLIRWPAADPLLPAYRNNGCPAPRFMQLGCQKAGTRHRLLTLHCRPPPAQVELQLQTESGRSPQRGFGTPEPEESDAGQLSFVGAGKRPKGARGNSLAKRPIHPLKPTFADPIKASAIAKRALKATDDGELIAAERLHPKVVNWGS
jgi:hypothetical protein